MAGRKSKPLARQDIDLLVAMLRYAALISRPMRDGVADPAGLSSNELRILMALSGEGRSAGHDLAELMGMHTMNVSRALTSLARMGLVERVRDQSNLRRKPYRVSARGAAAHRALLPRIGEIAADLFGSLSVRDRAALRRILAVLDAQVVAWQPRVKRQHVPRA